MATRNGSGPSLKITDMTDRELLALLADIETGGWSDVQTLAEAIWPRRAATDGRHCRRVLLTRLAWITRMSGMVEKHDKLPLMYRLTDDGYAFLDAKLTAGQRNVITHASDEKLAEVMALLGDRYGKIGGEMQWLVRREWQHRAARR